MAEYPFRITTGVEPCRTTYILQSGEFLLRFAAKTTDSVIEKALKTIGATGVQGEAYRRVAEKLRAAGLYWVALAKQVDDLHEWARNARRQFASIELCAPVYYQAGQGPETAAAPIPDTLMVRFKGKGSLREAKALAEKNGLQLNEAMSKLLAPFYYFSLGASNATQGRDGFDLLPSLDQNPDIGMAELDWLKLDTYMLIPSDPNWANQWNMTQIGMPGAWDVSTGTGTVWIAMIDSTFDLAHPDLTFTPNTGGSLTHFDADSAAIGGLPPYNASVAAVSHGMGTSGIAAARVNNAVGVAGIAGGCSVMPVRLGNVPTSAKVAAGVNWAAANGARVASLSLSTTSTAAAVAAFDNAWLAGLFICAATGNSGGNTTSPPVGFPATHPNVVAVGASDQNDQRKRPASADGECWGSQFGPEVDLVAPGVMCWSTDEQGATGNNATGAAVNVACVAYPSSGDVAGDYFALFDGTSAATPHVAGVAALLFSRYPAITNQTVRDTIERTCSKVNPGMYPYAFTAGRTNGTWHTETGYGRLNANGSVELRGYHDLRPFGGHRRGTINGLCKRCVDSAAFLDVSAVRHTDQPARGVAGGSPAGGCRSGQLGACLRDK